jgi:hypothetical protein
MTFKHCPACRFEWPSRGDFLGDPDIVLVGYQVNFKALTAGVMLFNHRCKGTLGIYVEDFKDLYDGPVFKACVTGSEECSGYCAHQGNLKPCPAQCECAYVREIIQIINAWPKRGKPILTGIA